ncbi:rod shape-determining protein [Vibrio zhanjiangensis]|uniref:rod shape-determining protein n=1 Tax=Vibrio zhanjiangensis TaxID=1046128 RepID=UPI0024E15348|nr:rod shape-determining protein [Vibrio zhanjiangensis]
MELSEKKIIIKTLGSGQKFEYEPYLALKIAGKKAVLKGVGSEAKLQSGTGIKVINPFSHPRSFVADFYVAEKLIRHGLYEVHKSKFFKPAPRIIIHQLEKTEGGLTNIEERVLTELALGSGAREVAIYIGERLDSDRITFDEVKKKIAV